MSETNEESNGPTPLFEALDGKARKTTLGYDSATSNFNAFAKAQGLKPFSLMTTEDLENYGVEKLLREFSTYLLNKTDCVFTALQYLSGMKMQIEFYHSELECFHIRHRRDGVFPWYSKVYGDLKYEGIKRAHKAGRNVITKPESITRKLLRVIITALLILNNENAIMQAAAMVILWSALGRASELSLATWNSMIFDHRELEFPWKEAKTRKEGTMLFPPDRYHYQLCPIHSMGRYLITYKGVFQCHGQEDPSVRWLFPGLVNRADSYVADHLTRQLRNLVKNNKVQGLKENPKISGFRNGATEHIRFDSRLAGLAEVTARGTWKAQFKKIAGNEVEYVNNVKNKSAAGLSLHAYEAVNECPPAFSLDPIRNDDNEEILNLLIDRLFCKQDIPMLKRGGCLRDLAECMLAAQLMYLRDYASLCEKNIVTDAIYLEARKLGVKKEQLHEWGRTINLFWMNGVDRTMGIGDARNLLERTNANLAKVNHLYTAVLENKQHISALGHKVDENHAELKEEVKSLREEVCALGNLCTTLSRTVDRLNRNIERLVSSSSTPSVNLQASSSQDSSRATPSTTITTTQSQVPEETTPLPVEATGPPRKKAKKPYTVVRGKSEELAAEHFNIFGATPNLMAAELFCKYIQVFCLYLSNSQPFAFKYDGQKKSKLLDAYRHIHKSIDEKDFERLNAIKKAEKKTKDRLDEQFHDEILEIFKRAVFNLKSRIDEDLTTICRANGKKVKQKLMNATDTTVGALAGKLIDVRTSKDILSQERRHFYICKGFRVSPVTIHGSITQSFKKK